LTTSEIKFIPVARVSKGREPARAREHGKETFTPEISHVFLGRHVVDEEQLWGRVICVLRMIFEVHAIRIVYTFLVAMFVKDFILKARSLDLRDVAVFVGQV
jgi:hypothetical protein